ncbi:hypothetical protein RG963_06830 [Methanosarcina sp. Z-7115]|uniref:Uncharacterized protein n=1 Tax=Methanosarcina baikalica TaxID=3073890 RepID=A0ABU2D0H8_9EURY|nr:hypothetical protein [Methanosarcina sp. Z-7115]MDR7665497.1 hypothetical protein [Methanosarcina sp. Z-7115]
MNFVSMFYHALLPINFTTNRHPEVKREIGSLAETGTTATAKEEPKKLISLRVALSCKDK